MIDLKAFRKANNLTQASVAKYLGVSEPFISQIEKGKNKLPSDKLEMLMQNNEGWNVIMLMNDEHMIGATRVADLFADPRKHTVSWYSGPIETVNLGPRKSSDIKLDKLYDENVRLKKQIEDLRTQIDQLKKQTDEYWEMIKKLTDK